MEQGQMQAVRQMASIAGTSRHVAGLAAEAQVARHYLGAGLQILARRWRGRAGEIDIIARTADGSAQGLVFIEVKKSRDLSTAALRLTRAQMARLATAAEEYLGSLVDGGAMSVRFDVALVDRHGRLDIIENALLEA